MSEDTVSLAWSRQDLRAAAGLLARKFVGGFWLAVSARTWMPGACHGATAAGSLLGEHRAHRDEG